MTGKEMFWELVSVVANFDASDDETELFNRLAFERLPVDDQGEALSILLVALHEAVSAVVVAAYGLHKTSTERDQDIQPDDLHQWLTALRESTERARNV